ncbi:hypothetical protein [Staphylococcus epidermidis]|nr:hypothetical protein [Staphylococcus epidermidis]
MRQDGSYKRKNKGESGVLMGVDGERDGEFNFECSMEEVDGL